MCQGNAVTRPTTAATIHHTVVYLLTARNAVKFRPGYLLARNVHDSQYCLRTSVISATPTPLHCSEQLQAVSTTERSAQCAMRRNTWCSALLNHRHSRPTLPILFSPVPCHSVSIVPYRPYRIVSIQNVKSGGK